jgi:hypothetical protein
MKRQGIVMTKVGENEKKLLEVALKAIENACALGF